MAKAGYSLIFCNHRAKDTILKSKFIFMFFLILQLRKEDFLRKLYTEVHLV
jgi:hypothetical protein